MRLNDDLIFGSGAQARMVASGNYDFKGRQMVGPTHPPDSEGCDRDSMYRTRPRSRARAWRT